MKRLYKKILTAVLACCVALSLAACAGGSGTGTATPPAGNSETTTETTAESASPEGSEAQDTLAHYDYVIDMKGNQVEITIATNLQSLRGEIKSMGLEFTSKCEIDGNILKLTECVDGNEQVWNGVAASSYTLHDDGTATPVSGESSDESAAELARYDYVIDMKGNQVEITIATNLQSLKAEIKSMGLEFTSKCEIDGNVLKLTECVDGNEQVWNGVAASSYTLHDDGTATAIE